MGEVAVAEKKGPKGSKAEASPQADGSQPEPTSEPKEGETTSRLFVTDAKKLSDLAQLRGEKISVCFRRVFSKLLDSKLIEAAEKRAEELRKGQDS